MSRTPQSPFALLDLDALLSEEERAIRDVVRQYVDDRIRPEVADWFETGTIPARELAREMGSLGLLGMHLEGYGCAGTSATAYGLACLELEAGDSGHPLAGERAGLARDVRHPRVRLRGAQAGVAAPHGGRRGDRLLRPHRAGLRLEPERHAHGGQARRRRLDPRRHQDVDHERHRRRRRGGLGPHRRGHPRLRRPHRHPRFHRPRDPQEALAARLGHRRAHPRGRAPARPTRSCPGSPACAARSPA